MKHKNSHLLVGYWSRLRKGRGTPDQTEIDPRAIKRFLPYVFILDCESPARPTYRLAGTSLCERFGYELKGTSFLAHWEAQSGLSLAPLLSQALRCGQPLCLSSIAATIDNGMVELESVLAPVSFHGGQPTRFLGLVQMLSNPAPLLRRTIAYQRLIGSQLIQEGEPHHDQTLPPPPPPTQLKTHPKAPYLRLVVSRQSPALLNFGSGDLLQQMVQAFNRWHAANSTDDSRIS
ncbi:MAG TPA: PAS domain-containing protein [Rhizomicrobium sp.]|nr:PAS domain-containing protein [Rhizomicrobium sp.]